MTSPQTYQGLSDDEREVMADRMEAVAKSGDRAAFGVIFEFYAPRLKGYLMRLGATEPTAEEVVQDVMLTVWRKAALFDRRQASVSTWLFRVARNRRIDLARRADKPELSADEPLLTPSEELAPDESVSAAEREAAVRRAIAELPPEQADMLRMAFFEGLSHRDIAEAAELPLGTVKSRIRLAFSRLRNALDDLAS